jgi:hypothetical protein
MTAALVMTFVGFLNLIRPPGRRFSKRLLGGLVSFFLPRLDGLGREVAVVELLYVLRRWRRNDIRHLHPPFFFYVDESRIGLERISAGKLFKRLVHVAPSLRRHRRTFRSAPQLYGADRGFFSENNLAVCASGGVAMACIPQRGGRKTPQRQAYERSPAFKQGQRFRAGIEGRISVLMRGRGMKRCRAEGAERFALFVGAAVLANNLMIIGELLTKRSRRRRNTNRQFLS